MADDGSVVVKPGYKTTEFWLSVFTTLTTVIGQLSGVIPAPWGMIAAAVVTCGYSIARGLTKTPPAQTN